MDLQETYNTVVQHLRQQGHRSVDETGRCVYLSPDGSRCPVGALIPDGHPLTEASAWPSMKGISVYSLLIRYPDLAERIAPSQDHYDLLVVLRLIHDNPGSWSDSGLSPEGRDLLRRAAWLFDLDDSVTQPQVGAG